jgi:hypothetical protein
VTTDTLATHNVVATYYEPDHAQKAMVALQERGIPLGRISFLAREAERAAARGETMAEPGDSPDVAKTAAGGAAAGAAGGGAAGFVAGAIAFGIPGIGPAVGTGIWAATLGGAAAGAAAGGVAGGIARMWHERYEDAVREGRLVVGVHSDDEIEVARAAEVLVAHDPDRVDRYDSEGRMISSRDQKEVEDKQEGPDEEQTDEEQTEPR